MKLPLFQLEEFWKKHEFSAPYLFCPSDAESWMLEEILALADQESLCLWEKLQLSYTESLGLPALREAIAQLYLSLNYHDILTTAGAEEGIYCAMQALLSPKDHVIVVSPCYQSLHTLPESLGATVTRVPLTYQQGWRLDFHDMETAFRPTTKLVILNCPHNPTGSLIEESTLQGIISCARARGSYIFSDEVYRYLEMDETERLPAMADLYEKGISLNVMTKSFGLAGLRIGWLASHDAIFLRKAAEYKMYTSICNSAPSEILALIALRAKEFILLRNRRIIQDNLSHLDTFFAKYSDYVRWVRPKGGTMGFPELLLPISTEEFTEQLIAREGVLIIPSSLFFMEGNFFRIGFGRKNMPQVLGKFVTALENIVSSLE